MTSFTLVVAVTAFLSGAAAAVFLMLVIGIRKADRPPPSRRPDCPAGRGSPDRAGLRQLAGWPRRPHRPPRRLTGTA